ncbi:MAG: hypothetical protein DRR08_01950 [Candidatus Parabeggiatoa sp. nov. 2]|nr:MAG: hypothetical protein B6247_04770 [Beggiatoa sp. 4572_84]RKZ64046.1 MAG: hypothetical protein DRR08_01950 [Gammaproteobacteria bacterium]
MFINKHFAKWIAAGSWECAFNSSVLFLKTENKLDISVIHGDASKGKPKRVVMELGILVINLKKAKKPGQLLITMATFFHE